MECPPPPQKNKEIQRLLPLLNISSINLVLPYQNFIISESDKLKYYTPVSGLNVALLIITHFSEIWLIHLSADVAVLKTQNIIFYNAVFTSSHESKFLIRSLNYVM